MIPEAFDRYQRKYATTKGSASCYRFCFAVIRTFDLSFQRARATSARHRGAMAGLITGAYGGPNGSTLMGFTNGWLSSYNFMSTRDLLQAAGGMVARDAYGGDGRMSPADRSMIERARIMQGAFGKVTVQSLSRAQVPGRQTAVIGPIRNGIISDVWGTPRGDHDHDGIDITVNGGSYGNNIYPTPGKIIKVVTELDGGAGGIRVSVKGRDGFVHSYNHLIPGSNSHIKVGQFVSSQISIGQVGRSSYWNPYGVDAHLHYSIISPVGRKIDPFLYNSALGLLPRR